MGRARPGALTLALVGLLAAACSDSTGEMLVKHEPAAYTEEARKLLGGLAPGDDLAGWTVESVQGPHDSEITVRVHKGEIRFDAWLVRTGTTEQLPPVSTAEYDLFFGRPIPAETSLPKLEAEQVLGLLAERITKNEASVAPEGL